MICFYKTPQNRDGRVDAGDILDADVAFALFLTEFATAHVGRRGGESEDATEDFALIEGTLGVGDEEEGHGTGFQHEAFGTATTTETAQGADAQEFFGFGGKRAETVEQAAAIGFEFVVALQTVEFAIEQHALGGTGHVGFGEIGVEVALDIALRGEISAEGFGRLAGEFFGEEIGEFVVFEFGNGFGENLLIGLISQIGDETTLLGAQEIAGAADVEILHGDVDAAAEIGKALDGLQAAATVVGQGAEGRRHEIAEGFLAAASHATTHLVQVGKSEVLGVVDEDGIGVRHVDAVFDDGGGEKNVELVIDKIEDYFL